MGAGSLFAGAALVATLGVLSGCATTSVTSFKTPDGADAHTVKCSTDRARCYAEASRSCGGGTYRALASESHAGGIALDILPGPVTWYTMTYACGATDGRLPEFPFGGVPAAMPPMPMPAVRTNCTTFGNTTNCTSR